MNIRPRIKNMIFSFVGEVTVHMLAIVTTILIYQSIYLGSHVISDDFNGMHSVGNSNTIGVGTGAGVAEL